MSKPLAVVMLALLPGCTEQTLKPITDLPRCHRPAVNPTQVHYPQGCLGTDGRVYR